MAFANDAVMQVFEHMEPTDITIALEQKKFRGELLGALDTLAARAKRTSGLSFKPSKAIRRVREACNVLQVDPPRAGRPIDLDKARRNRNQLVREYHPDGGGSEDTRGAYQQVIEAFELLDHYNESLEPSEAPPERQPGEGDA